MKYHILFFRKLGNMSQNLSSAAVVIGALRVKAERKAKIRNRHNQVPQLTRCTIRESDKNKNIQQTSESRGQPFPSR